MDPKIDRGQLTRRHILSTATNLFAEHGFDATSIETILRACDISRGALYHHFGSKEAVFTAVVEAIEEELVGKLIQSGGGAGDAMSGLRAGCLAWLDMASDPVIRRIVLTDAPAVLGWTAWRALEARYSLGVLKAGLGAVSAEGRLAADMVDWYAHVMLAMLTELAMLIARAPDIQRATASAQETVERFLAGVLNDPPATS